jgi:hypothetical protein
MVNVMDPSAWAGILGETSCGKDFLIRSLQPSSYSFNLSVGRGRSKDTLAIDVKDRNIDITASLHRGANVEGQVIRAEGARLPLDRFQVSTRPVGALPFLDEMQYVSPDAQGKFHLENLSFVRRRLALASVGASYYLKEVRFNDVALPDNIFTVTGPGSLQIILDDKPAAVSGVVSESDHRVSQPYVVLAKWPTSSVAPLNFAIGGADGKFQFTGLAPGDYRIFAIAQTEMQKLHEPHVLDRVLAAAERISLGPLGSQTLSLTLADPAR